MADLIQRIDVRASAEEVWAEITKLGAVQRAMMDTVLATTLEPGAPLRYTSRDGKRTFIVGRIIEVDPPRRLVHSFVLTTRSDPPTLVTWTLDSLGPRSVRVTVTHTGYPEATPKLGDVDRTWAGILAQLKRVLEAGDVSPGTRAQYLLMRAFMWAMPAKTKTESVPVPDFDAVPTPRPDPRMDDHPGR